MQYSLLIPLNFSLDIPTSVVTDTSSRKLNGIAVNTPTRAVTGHNWPGREMDFKHATCCT